MYCLFKKLWEALKSLGKWLLTRVLNFAKNIKAFFVDRMQRAILQKNKEVIACSIKEKLNNGNYGVVNCLYNQETEDVVSMDYATEVEAEQLDAETALHFGNKDMIVLT